MKTSVYNTYEELPLFLNAQMVAEILGISLSHSYELMNGSDFPALRIGSRIVVPKEKFQLWVEETLNGGGHGN